MKQNLKISEAVNLLENHISSGMNLPDDIFYFITRHSPMINVDLFVKNSSGDVLLAWRDDQYCGTGWHIPGGIIRYKETAAYRIEQVAAHELGVRVVYEEKPIDILETIVLNQDNRGHFISLLYKCKITSTLDDYEELLKQNKIKWHSKCPENLLAIQSGYLKYMP